VKFTLTPGKEQGKILKLRLEERRKNLHQLRFGMNYESRFDDAESDKMIFLVNSTFNQLTGTGSYWSSDLQFVNVTKFDSEYFQPLGKGFFIAPYLYDHDDYQIIYENEESVARYDRTERGSVFVLALLFSGLEKYRWDSCWKISMYPQARPLILSFFRIIMKHSPA
jgi:hypothetical protein